MTVQIIRGRAGRAKGAARPHEETLALSIQQPWAWAILHLGKDVENRTWHRNYRGALLIHAGKKIDIEAIAWIRESFGDCPGPSDLPTGGIVGRCDVVGYIHENDREKDPRHCSPWFFGPWGWCLANAQPMPFRPYPGRLGLFNVSTLEGTSASKA